MRNKFVALALLTGGLTLACSDSVGPPPDTEPGIVESRVLHPLKWQAMNGPLQLTAEYVADGDTRLDREGVLGSPSAGAPPLDSYEVSFRAKRKETRGVLISWLEPSGDTTIAHPYLEFIVPAFALYRRPGGDRFEENEGVRITITMDPTAMVAHFSPSGLQFRADNPAQLQYWYTGAGGDLNDDGSVDQADADIEVNLLDLWESLGTSGDWAPVSAEHSMTEDWFKAGVGHFSGFAIAY